MKIYLSHGIKEFIICLGYRGYVIKEYFSNYALHMSTVTFDMEKSAVHVHENMAEPWKITLVDTGEHTQTGGRLKRVRDYLGDEDFCMTYGDGVGDIDVSRWKGGPDRFWSILPWMSIAPRSQREIMRC